MDYIPFLKKNNVEITINEKFKKMDRNKLIDTIYKLQEENNEDKELIEKLSLENNDLKDTILLRQKNSSHTSEIKNIYNDLKHTLFSSDNNNINEADKELKDFIYDQYLLYGGLEEEEINDLNQLKIKEDNWSDNQDFFNFKQKIIERNYQELFRNIAVSNELQKLFGTKKNIKNENKKENEKIKVKQDTEINKTNIKEENLPTVEETIRGGEKNNKKNKSNKKEKKIENKNSNNNFNFDSINPLKKKEKNNDFLNDLLDEDENKDEEDKEYSLKNLINENKNNGWEEED